MREKISRRLRFDVFSRDDFTCQYCGRRAPDVVLEADHVLPVSKGGKTVKENLRTACFDCNRGKFDRTPGCGNLPNHELQEEYFAGLSASEFYFVDPYVTALFGPLCL